MARQSVEVDGTVLVLDVEFTVEYGGGFRKLGHSFGHPPNRSSVKPRPWRIRPFGARKENCFEVTWERWVD